MALENTPVLNANATAPSSSSSSSPTAAVAAPTKRSVATHVIMVLIWVLVALLCLAIVVRAVRCSRRSAEARRRVRRRVSFASDRADAFLLLDDSDGDSSNAEETALLGAHFDYYYSDRCDGCKRRDPNTGRWVGMTVSLYRYVDDSSDDNFPLVLHNWVKRQSMHEFKGVDRVPTLRFTDASGNVEEYGGSDDLADVREWMDARYARCASASSS